MTREEAIARLKVLTDYEYDEDLEALDMAIKALEQEQQPCEDCISRQAVLNYQQTFTDNAGYETQYVDVEDVKVLPSVAPNEKTGHWIIVDDCEKFIAKCSECGRTEDSRMISKYPYCHCGARMVEPQESEE